MKKNRFILIAAAVGWFLLASVARAVTLPGPAEVGAFYGGPYSAGSPCPGGGNCNITDPAYVSLPGFVEVDLQNGTFRSSSSISGYFEQPGMTQTSGGNASRIPFTNISNQTLVLSPGWFTANVRGTIAIDPATPFWNKSSTFVESGLYVTQYDMSRPTHPVISMPSARIRQLASIEGNVSGPGGTTTGTYSHEANRYENEGGLVQINDAVLAAPSGFGVLDVDLIMPGMVLAPGDTFTWSFSLETVSMIEGYVGTSTGGASTDFFNTASLSIVLPAGFEGALSVDGVNPAPYSWISTVPLPASVWLLLSGFGLLLGWARCANQDGEGKRMKTRLLGVVSACTIAIISLPAQAVPVSGQGTWETTLQGRDLDGNAATYEAYYDTTLDITWLADANVNGLMQWPVADTWAANLNVYGVTGWRLPTMVDTGAPGCDFAYTGTDCGYNVQTGSAATTVYSEMASLFYDTLGNLSEFDTSGNSPQPGWGLTNTGPFSNLQDSMYWTGLEYAPLLGWAWDFFFIDGNQGADDMTTMNYTMAVLDGDVNAVPLPAAVWLFGSGFIGLICVARRRRKPILASTGWQ